MYKITKQRSGDWQANRVIRIVLWRENREVGKGHTCILKRRRIQHLPERARPAHN